MKRKVLVPHRLLRPYGSLCLLSPGNDLVNLDLPNPPVELSVIRMMMLLLSWKS